MRIKDGAAASFKLHGDAEDRRLQAAAPLHCSGPLKLARVVSSYDLGSKLPTRRAGGRDRADEVAGAPRHRERHAADERRGRVVDDAVGGVGVEVERGVDVEERAVAVARALERREVGRRRAADLGDGLLV